MLGMAQVLALFRNTNRTWDQATELWGYGANGSGQARGDGTTDLSGVVSERIESGIVGVANGQGHTLYVKSSGDVFGFGDNKKGAVLATPNGYPQKVVLDAQKIDSNTLGVYAAGNRSAILLNNGDVKTWGDDFYGQSSGTATNTSAQPKTRIARGAISVAMSPRHTLILFDDKSVKAFGYNAQGQCSADGIPTPMTPLGNNVVATNAKAIACDGNHSLVLLESGEVLAFGANGANQSSGMKRKPFVAGRRPPADVEAHWIEWSTQPATIIDTGIKAIEALREATVLLTETGEVKAFGKNTYNEVKGTAPRNGFHKPTGSDFAEISTVIFTDIKEISCGVTTTMLLTNDNKVIGFGGNHDGQAQNNPTPHGDFAIDATEAKVIAHDVKQIFCGQYTSFWGK